MSTKSGGYYSYNQREPKENCPYCGRPCHADWVDVGIAFQQCGPFFCENCKASEIGSFDTPRKLSDIEEETGWYAPGEPISDKANQIDGLPIDHITAKVLYRKGCL